jgi:hypothetical protein
MMLSYDVSVNATPLGRVSVALDCSDDGHQTRSRLDVSQLSTDCDAYTVVWRGPPRAGHGAAETCLFRAPGCGHVVRGAPILAFVGSMQAGAVVCVSNISVAVGAAS